MRRRDWRWLAAGAGVAALLIAAVLVFRGPLAEWLWPEARVQALRQQAAAALQRGHLTAADGSGARELYEAVIAIDPDRAEARTGLARVARAALVQGEAALAREDFVAAQRALALARELDAPRAAADQFSTRLRERQATAAGIPGLLDRAVRASAAGRLDGAEDAALPLYARVLALRPQNVRALEGREDALSELLQQARTALRTGKIEEGAALVASAGRYDPGHMDLPQLRGELARATDAVRQRAQRDLRRGNLDAATVALQRLLAIDAQDAASGLLLREAAAVHAGRAERAAADFDFRSAERELRRARALQADAPTVARVERRLAQARQARARLAATDGKVQGRTAQRRVAALLREAARAEERGDLLAPPGESAYDKLRAASAIAPDNAAVRRAQRRLAPAARACFERELARNALGRARTCMESWAALGAAPGAVTQSRQRLAQRWLAVGDERLSAGELANARSALRTAQELAPDAAGLADFSARLEQALRR